MSQLQNLINKFDDDGLSQYKEQGKTKPLVLIDLNFRIAYCNHAFIKIFNLTINDDLNTLSMESELLFLLKGFIGNKYKNLTTDVSFQPVYQTKPLEYTLMIERILINSEQFVIISFDSHETRKQIEQKINSLHHALDKGNVPIIIIDSNKKITYLTRSFEDLFSKPLDIIFFHPVTEVFADLFSPADYEEFCEAISEYKNWKKLVSVQKRNLTEYWEFSLNPVYFAENSEVIFILSAGNLTEYIRQKQHIEKSEKKQRLIIENISDQLLILEYAGSEVVFENANDNFLKMFEVEKRVLLNKSIEKFLPAELIKSILDAINYLTENKDEVYEFNYTYTDNRVFACKISSTLETVNNRSILIISMKDITEQLLYQEQLKRAYFKEMQLNKMKSDFLANMSHEIRTPFNAIVGYSELIDESIEHRDFEILQELMGSMREVLARALNLFTNIVDVYQIEMGEVELDKVELHINPVVKNVYQKKIDAVARKKLDFLLNMCDEECVVEVDWVKLEKIIHLLLDNAIKYTNEGFVSLATRQVDQKAEILISDTGVGIEQENIERLLKPFTQEIEGYTRPFEGAGLGLTLAFKLTNLLGGEFFLESKKNKGTEIRIVFPIINNNVVY